MEHTTHCHFLGGLLELSGPIISFATPAFTLIGSSVEEMFFPKVLEVAVSCSFPLLMCVALCPAGGSHCIPHAVWGGKVMDRSSQTEATSRCPCHCMAGHPVILVAFRMASCYGTSGEVHPSSLDVMGGICVPLLGGFWDR